MSTASRPFGSEPGEAVIATGNCYACGNPFSFHPDLVCTVIVDADTDRPADHPDAGNGERVSRPVCLPCVKTVNPLREARGNAPFEVLPGAYPEGS